MRGTLSKPRLGFHEVTRGSANPAGLGYLHKEDKTAGRYIAREKGASGHREKVTVCKPRTRALGETDPVGTSRLALQPPEPGEHQCVLLVSPACGTWSWRPQAEDCVSPRVGLEMICAGCDLEGRGRRARSLVGRLRTRPRDKPTQPSTAATFFCVRFCYQCVNHWGGNHSGMNAIYVYIIHER